MTVVVLDLFHAVFQRRSGITHLLSEPAPEILAALADAPLTTSALLAVLGERYELADGDAASLSARLGELEAAGLVERLAPAA